MELMEKLASLSEQAIDLQHSLRTEEATKNALILPFLRALGYDPFNPREVNAEFTADVGVKKHEKVDYAICLNDVPVMLVECKCCGADLCRYSSQLYRYYSVTPARVALLTDGLTFRFYSDLVARNKLDEQPFFTMNLTEIKAEDAAHLQQFTKGAFNLDTILRNAEELRSSNAVREHFAKLLQSPSDDMVREFVAPIHTGRFTEGAMQGYRKIVQAAIAGHLNMLVEQRLQRALDQARNGESPSAGSKDEVRAKEDGVETTMEELQGFFVVKAILADRVDLARIVPRDVQSYFGVLLDDNNRKPICRLWFNTKQKYLGVFDASKKETRIPIKSVDEIFKHAEAIRSSLQHVIHAKDSADAPTG